MKLATIKSEGIAHHSYFLSDQGEAVVIDPRRDCQIYEQLAQKECDKIRYIFETHRNEDYVIGSLELKNRTNSEIAHSKELPFKYGDHKLSDGESINVGSLRIQALYTPGHTKESMSYVVFKTKKRGEALMVFSGDTLFVGSVGRTDLYGKDAQTKQAEALYESIHEVLLPLGDDVTIYPAHGAGSVCGTEISNRDSSTIGYEKKTNHLLNLDKNDFVNGELEKEMLVPPYFRKMEEYNLDGPPLLPNNSLSKALSLQEFEEQTKSPNTTVVDTRMPYAFASAFIPGSLSIWLDGTSTYPGWVLDYSKCILSVHERKEDAKKATLHLHRLGFDNLGGFLCKGINAWLEKGKPTDRIGVLSSVMLKTKLNLNELTLIDVRKPREWKEGYVKSAKRVFVGHLPGKTNNFELEKPLACICSVGFRGSLGTSILKRQGFKNVYNVLGGMTAWSSLNYPTVKH